jgi:hypothetical protein
MLLCDRFYRCVQINPDTIHESMIVKYFYRLLLTVTLTLCKLCINYGPVRSFPTSPVWPVYLIVTILL